MLIRADVVGKILTRKKCKFECGLVAIDKFRLDIDRQINDKTSSTCSMVSKLFSRKNSFE